VAGPQEALLADGLAAQGVECDQSTRQKLIDFARLLQKWNKVYNLTAIRDPRQIIIRHILDSLSVLPYLQGPRILDVGAGAGLPGIPLALVRPDLSFTECDSVSKKTRFMQQAVTELGLKNVGVIHSRVEDLHDSPLFDTVISRAFAPLADIIRLAGPLCAPSAAKSEGGSSGAILAMKGVFPEHELADIPEGYVVQGVHELSVFSLDEQRTLVKICPVPSSAGNNQGK
jgi:16S rRNA (guanine527-N7)-methyltransferase